MDPFEAHNLSLGNLQGFGDALKGVSVVGEDVDGFDHEATPAPTSCWGVEPLRVFGVPGDE